MALPDQTPKYSAPKVIPLRSVLPVHLDAFLGTGPARYRNQLVQMALLKSFIESARAERAWTYLKQRAARELARKQGPAPVSTKIIPFPVTTEIRYRAGVRLEEWTFVRWTPNSLVAVDHTGIQREIKRERLLEPLLARTYFITGYRPPWAILPGERKPQAKPIPKPTPKEEDTFIASKAKGGGKIRVKGEWWDWSKVVQRCRCVCGDLLSSKLSDESCPSRGGYGGYYYACNSGHAIKGEHHLRIKPPRHANPDVMPPGSLAAVQAAYPWINATTEADEPPPF